MLRKASKRLLCFSYERYLYITVVLQVLDNILFLPNGRSIYCLFLCSSFFVLYHTCAFVEVLNLNLYAKSSSSFKQFFNLSIAFYLANDCRLLIRNNSFQSPLFNQTNESTNQPQQQKPDLLKENNNSSFELQN